MLRVSRAWDAGEDEPATERHVCALLQKIGLQCGASLNTDPIHHRKRRYRQENNCWDSMGLGGKELEGLR